MKRLILALIFLGFSGCVDQNQKDGSKLCKEINAKVAGGHSCNQDSRSPVVLIAHMGKTASGKEKPFSACSGTLISSNDVLTAAHCVSGLDKAAEDRGLTFTGFAVFISGKDGEEIRAKSVVAHPKYSGKPASANDVAIITLKKTPSPKVTPLSLMVSQDLAKGYKLSAFGYGLDEKGKLGALKGLTFKISEIVRSIILAEGDGKSSVCPGDSGGPALMKSSSGDSGVVAVTSFGDANGCKESAAQFWGLVSVQEQSNLDFITEKVPDVVVE